MTSNMWHYHIKPLSSTLVIILPFLLVVFVFASHFSSLPLFFHTGNFSFLPFSYEQPVLWNARQLVEWRPCGWWSAKATTALPARSNGYIRVDCYGGLNQMRRDLCDGIGIARLLNATLVLPKFEVAAYWNESSGFEDIFDVDYFIQQSKGFVEIVKELPYDLSSKQPFKVDCSKRRGNFDYVEAVLPALKKHRYISITPAMSQRKDRYPAYAKAALCQSCYRALRLNEALENKGRTLLEAIPKPFVSLHLRFEPDMVAYSQCDYPALSPSSLAALSSARRDGRKPLAGDAAAALRYRGKCPLTPAETAFILRSLPVPADTNIYLASGDGLMEPEGLTRWYANVHTKSSLLDLRGMGGNAGAALDYFVSVNSDAYVATYFGNMDKMVAAMRALAGKRGTLFLSRRAFANCTAAGMQGEALARAMRVVHLDNYIMGRGTALPDCFCPFSL